jgi:hypothetical protein
MTAENGNGNGELRQLLEIKRAYRQGLTSLEGQLKADYERDLADGKKKLKEKYLEQVVDAVFAESTPVAPKVEVAEPSAPAEPESPKCPECGEPTAEGDKFCSRCASPLAEEPEKKGADMSEWPVASAGRKLKPRRR